MRKILDKRMKKTVSAMLILSLAISGGISGADSFAASKPSVAKSAKVSVGSSKKLSIKAKGFKVKKVTAKSSDKSVAKVKATKSAITVSGVTAGKATVTTTVKATKKGKTKSYKLKTKVTVSDGTKPDPSIGPLEEVTVDNQAALATALENAKNARITLKSNDENFDIKEGNYPNVDLVVDTPNAFINNQGVFRSITIKALKSSGWVEKGEGNTITVSAADQLVFEVHNVAKVKSLTYTGTAKNLQTIKVIGNLDNLNIASAEQMAITVSDSAKLGTMTFSGATKSDVEIKDLAKVDKMVISNAGADISMKIKVDAVLNSIDITKAATVLVDGESTAPTSVKAVKGAKVTIKAPNAVAK